MTNADWWPLDDVLLGRILTVTMNPALDVAVTVDELVPDHKLRATHCGREPGGGGVNVARALSHVGAASNSVVVVGGPVGDELVARMRAEGLQPLAIHNSDHTRESFAVTDASTTKQYRIVTPGPALHSTSEVIAQIQSTARGADVVVISGSPPSGSEPSLYRELVDGLQDCQTIVDCAGSALVAMAGGAATMLKPSRRELSFAMGDRLLRDHELVRAARAFMSKGDTTALLVSLGPDGALLVPRNDGETWLKAPAVNAVSTIGSGDSMVAGLAAALAGGLPLRDAARVGIAMGTAAVLTPGAALCEEAGARRLWSHIVCTD